MAVPVRLRSFNDRDYAGMVEVANAIFPLWDRERYDLLRLVGEDASGRIVARGQLNHLPHQFHQHRFRIGVYVARGSQRRGVGGQLHDRLTSESCVRRATAMNARVRDDMTASISFLEARRFVSVEETWESPLAVAAIDPARSADADASLASQGITITSLASEHGTIAPRRRTSRGISAGRRSRTM